MCCFTVSAQQFKTVEIDGKTVYSVEKQNKQNYNVKTPYQYMDSDSAVIDVWININNGHCYIYRISKKTGKQYKYYLPESVSVDIANKMGIKYIKPEKKV